MTIPSLVCFDIGARNGFPDLTPLSKYISLYSFEPNIADNDILNKNAPVDYAAYHLIKKGLYHAAGSYDFYVMANPSMSSMLHPDEALLTEYFGGIEEFNAWRNQLKIVNTTTIETTTIDDIVKTSNIKTIDYLKIDTQGTELAILKGAENALKDKKVVVIKIEFAFIPFYKGQPTFSDIDWYLKSMGYKMITCEFKYDIVSPFATQSENPKYGIGGDAFYCIDFDVDNEAEKMLKAAVVLGGLGFMSNASHLFRELRVHEKDQQAFYKKTRLHNKKTVLRYFVPPFLVHLYKKWNQ